MHISHYFSLIFPLGLAGFDPAPVVVAVLFLASHANRAGRRTTYLFSTIILAGTALWGVLLASLLGEQIQRIPWNGIWHWLLSTSLWAMVIKLVLGLALLGYGIYASRKLAKSTTPKEEKERSAKGIYIFALTFILVVTSDIPFAAFVGLSGHQPFWAQLVGMAGWALISQFPLVILVIAMLLGKDAWFQQVFDRFMSRWEHLFAWTIPSLCLLVGAVVLINVLVLLVLH